MDANKSQDLKAELLNILLQMTKQNNSLLELWADVDKGQLPQKAAVSGLIEATTKTLEELRELFIKVEAW